MPSAERSIEKRIKVIVFKDNVFPLAKITVYITEIRYETPH